VVAPRGVPVVRHLQAGGETTEIGKKLGIWKTSLHVTGASTTPLLSTLQIAHRVKSLIPKALVGPKMPAPG